MGLVYVFVALVGWGFGDFLIQKSIRKFGNWEVLFLIAITGFIFLTPFVLEDLFVFFLNLDWLSVALFFLLGLISLVAGLFDFEALKQGKIAIVEPIYTLELLVTAFLASIFLGEVLNLWQYILIFFLIAGIGLISITNLHDLKNFSFEKGVKLAILATVGMGAINFLFGLNSRQTDPLLVNWFVNLFLSISTFIYLYSNFKQETVSLIFKHKILIVFTCFFDNLAWVAFAASTVYIPIAVATGLSEAYIVIACLLGIFLNKETLLKHQYVGMIITTGAAIWLAFTI